MLSLIDDILIYGRDQNKHDENPKELLERLAKYNLEENLDELSEIKLR